MAFVSTRSGGMARVKQDQQSEQVERNGSESGSCCCWQVNSLPSMWYGIVVVALQVSAILTCLNVTFFKLFFFLLKCLIVEMETPRV